MNARMVSRLAAALMLAWVAGCRDTNPVPQTDVAQPTAAHVATLVVSDTAPNVGDTVRVALVLRLWGDTAVASYTARVSFDTTALRYADEATIADGGMRAYNVVDGELHVAGVSLKGFESGTLFAARFHVAQRGALASLRLALDEVHDIHLRDVKDRIRAAGGIARETP